MRLFLLILLFLLIPSVPTHALEIRDVRFGAHDDTTRFVLDLDSAADFRVFMLGDPVRMVIDLPAFDWRAGNLSEGSKAGITDVRHGRMQEGLARIVFDMSKPMSIQSAFMLPKSSDKPDRLVIDLAETSPKVFDQNRNIIYGTLNPDKTYENRALSGQNQEPRTAGLFSSVPRPDKKPPMDKPLGRPLIVIDPGHGGVDPGAPGPGFDEKEVVLGLAKALKRELEDSGQYRVIMTRETDMFVKLADRVKFARHHEADLFISIHADSIQKAGVGGASIYTLSETASDEQTEKLAARENKADLIAGIDLSVEDQDVANILVDLAMRDTMNQSKFFANKLVRTLPGQGVELLERPHRYAGFAVLKAPDVPSVLIESGFMSNEREARRLNTPEYRKKFAKALHGGIDAYFEQVRKNGRI